MVLERVLAGVLTTTEVDTVFWPVEMMTVVIPVFQEINNRRNCDLGA